MHGAAGVWAGQNVVQVNQKKKKPSRGLGVVQFRVYRVIFNVRHSFFPINFHFFVLNFILIFCRKRPKHCITLILSTPR